MSFKFTLYIFVLSLFMFASTANHAQQFSSAESAEYDANGNRWLVSNGNIIAVAADGTLSVFGSGTAEYGMEILGNTIFGVGAGVVRGYDLDTEQEVMVANIPGAQFLNGLCNNGLDHLYVTDFGAEKIHSIDVSDLSNPIVTAIVEDTETTPNGIIHDAANNRLLYTSWQGSNAPIKAVDLTDFSVSDVVQTNVGRIDGIDDDGDGNYYISSWSPNRITKYDADFANAPTTITTPFINSPADIGYSKETDTLAIPIGNDVVFVGFEMEPSANHELSAQRLQLSLFPNPMIAQSAIQFFLPDTQEAHVALYDLQGKMIAELMQGRQTNGWHKIALAGNKFSAGQYVVILKTKEGQASVPLIVN